MTQQNGSLVYVGTYTTRGSEGIYVYRFDPSSGALSPLGVAAHTPNPTFLAIAPNQRHLYAANEVAELEGQPGGAVSAFAIDADTGALTFLNRQPSRGTGPCHVTVDQTGQFVLAANYSSGSASILPIREDGRLGEASDFVQHEGFGPNERRQRGPHAHSVTLSPDNRFAFVADLGIDKMMIYRLDMNEGKLQPNDPPWAETYPGAGPRHFAFHPNGPYAYVINELGSSVTAFVYDSARGALRELQTVSTLPERFEGRNTCADMHISASGEFLYGSNRGHDSIAIFCIAPDTGRLTAIGHESTRGKTPRNFGLDPSGAFLLAANQDTDNIVSFRVDGQTGQLTPTGQETHAPAPVCIQWL
jgi:6-phosphogluconolactonase